MGSRQAGPLGVPEHFDHHSATAPHVAHHRPPVGRHRPGWRPDESLRTYLELHPLPDGLTATLLHEAIPGVGIAAANNWVSPLNVACVRYEITQTVRRMAAFLGHIAYESGDLHALKEDMNYPADRMIKVYPSIFKTMEEAALYVNKPEAFANKVYANRIGNGDADTGDGWRYRGRGLIQLTGRANYTAFGNEVNVDVVKNPDLLATPRYAALSAAWFWKKHGLNALADAENYQALSKRINSSLKSFPQREARRRRALTALCLAILANDTLSHDGFLDVY